MVDPDLELSGVARFVLLALPAFQPFVISSFFTQNKGEGTGGAPPLDPPLYTDPGRTGFPSSIEGTGERELATSRLVKSSPGVSSLTEMTKGSYFVLGC